MRSSIASGSTAKVPRSSSVVKFLPVIAIGLIPLTRGFSLVLLGGYLLLGWRVYRHYAVTGLSHSDAWLMSRHILYGKFAQVRGIFRYLRNRVRGRFEIIEYK